jgi:hypothetical protein
LDTLQQFNTLSLLLFLFLPLFFGTLLLIPWLLLRIPADYFHPDTRQLPLWADHHPILRAILIVGKNLLGLVVFLMGVAMLFLPGQGLLTILIGLLLLDFPGKYQAERWFVQLGPVLKAVNWLRSKRSKPPLEF